MLRCLCGSPSISLSFNLAAVLPRRDTYRVCFDTESQMLPSSSIHRLGRGLPGYLILFAPHAFEPQRQLQSSKPPSPLVFLLISTHSTATLGIPLTSPALQPSSFICSSAVKLRDFTYNLIGRLHSLYAQSFRTTLAPYVLPRLLARSLPGLSYEVPSFFVPRDRSLQSENLHPSRGVAGSEFPPLPNIPHCCLP